MDKIQLGVIGGSGVYRMENLEIIDQKDIDTPFGKPSDKITIGKLGSRLVAFLPRHGEGHIFSPTEVPYRANIYAFKTLGVERIIAISAVGSLKEEIRPNDFVMPDQIIDRTKFRACSFFGDGIVGHIGFADPFCEDLRTHVSTLIEHYFKEHYSNKRLHNRETLVCIEGPQFSTRAESNLYRSWGAGIIGMTTIPEAKLAREAEICYALIAMTTDYDCWKMDVKDVDVNMVLEYMKENNRVINEVLPIVLQNIPLERRCACQSAAQDAIITTKLSEQAKKKLTPLYGKYWK